MAEYRLTPAAERDLESIWTYTVRQWGVEQAARYIDFLTTAFAELADSPKTAPSCEHRWRRSLAIELQMGFHESLRIETTKKKPHPSCEGWGVREITFSMPLTEVRGVSYDGD